MTGHPPYQLSVAFAAVVGAAGFPLAVLAWRRFRGAPFGGALTPIPGFMLLLAVYHPVLLVLPASYRAALGLESIAFVLLAVFALQMVRVHRRLSRVSPTFLHAVHGIAALFVTVGLYGLLQGELDDAGQFEGMFAG